MNSKVICHIFLFFIRFVLFLVVLRAKKEAGPESQLPYRICIASYLKRRGTNSVR